jgi:hypothetical protein
MKTLILLLFPTVIFSQVNLPNVPQATQFQNYSNQNYSNPYNRNILPSASNQNFYSNFDQQRQNLQDEQIKREIEQYERSSTQAESQTQKEINEYYAHNLNYSLPSLENVKGTEYYRNVYDKMLTLKVESYSIKDVNFDIENAYFENKQDKAAFDKVIQQSGKFIIDKMKELNYDTNSNPTKNFMLFQFFSETLQLKANGLKHLPLKYDFDDYWGQKDWSKMFVTKLLRTAKGQCHSMPLLYLTLAEEIGATAYLSICPNHSYIKFQDEKGKWYNIELTNGMLTVPSFILNSGYIKSEAMQNKIYMQNLSKKELLSQLYTDLAMGYYHKFGYDDFVEKVVNKALDLYPNNISAQMVKANYNTAHLKYVVKALEIDTKTQEGREQILNYPEAVEILKKIQTQNKVIDDLGYQFMPADAYQKWLGSLKEAKNKQDDETLRKQFKGIIIKKTKG